jgi:hypothetical protein
MKSNAISPQKILENVTRNQHFLPRVEQKLNSRNPNASNDKLKIYSFRVTNRERYSIELEGPNGRSIGSNMSLFDLFSFDVPEGGSIRMNFEALFDKYETNIEVHTRSLLAKLPLGSADIKAEIIDLFAAKLLNFVRNPFCIPKVLNTFPKVGSYEPTNPILLDCYRRIINGRKPHQAHLCSQLGITNQIYVEWLRTLFILLIPAVEGHPNIFEGMIKSLIENPNTYVRGYVYDYDSKLCLLSDRGFCQPIPDGSHMALSFNLCSNAFIHYVFADIGTLCQDSFPQGAVEFAKSRLGNRLDVSYQKNDLSMLKLYNRRVIEQCHERVYCSSKDAIDL